MKKILFLTITLSIINGCCLVTSMDCGCDPPDEQFLNEEPKKWLLSLENGGYQVFEDQNGNLDSLKIRRFKSSNWIGGEECGADSELERAILQSHKFYDIRMTIEASWVDAVEINNNEDREGFIHAHLNTRDNNLIVFNENTSAIIEDNFIWNGETSSVLIISCENSSDCFSFEMRKFIISKELGLLEYIDRGENIWKRIN